MIRNFGPYPIFYIFYTLKPWDPQPEMHFGEPWVKTFFKDDENEASNLLIFSIALSK